jgi:hypothetical protein
LKQYLEHQLALIRHESRENAYQISLQPPQNFTFAVLQHFWQVFLWSQTFQGFLAGTSKPKFRPIATAVLEHSPSFSNDWQTRIATARTIGMKPAVLIADFGERKCRVDMWQLCTGLSHLTQLQDWL